MTATRRVVVGSRSSPLALAQTEEVVSRLRVVHPNAKFEIVPLSTIGDRNKTDPLLSMERGMFVKDIEAALLSGEIDFAVHSAKDLPADLPAGLTIAAFTERQDARDVIVDRWGLPFDDLPAGARLGTSSPRRVAQLKARRPDLEFIPIRGNVGTRMEKSGTDEYDGVVLAAAGILRLGRASEISDYLPPEVCLPDVGQGALAAETRADDDAVIGMLAAAEHTATSQAVRAERAFLQAMGGGCTVPVAAYAIIEDVSLKIVAMASSLDGADVIRIDGVYDKVDPEHAGREIAAKLLERGARDILKNS
ncbi:MAG: hydroxymethylbilane synthase [Chloroflexi bacterium]|nr:hydroxymethylbilane synthase [Chloroflexota bacterium]